MITSGQGGHHGPSRCGTISIVPELPEVETLATELRARAGGLVIDRAAVAEFSVLKTYDPPLTALHGMVIADTARYGKFLDIVVTTPDRPAGPDTAADGSLHLITHLARAGWLRWRDQLPTDPPRPGKGPLAFRLRFTDG